MHGNKKQSVALSSVFASVFLTVSKLIVGLMTGSIGIISEAAHSALDFGAALLTYFTVRVSDKPADEKHHYGHAKLESVSALIETGLLFITSFWIIYEAVRRLTGEKFELEVTWYAFAVIGVSIIVDISRSRALKKVADETHSQALEADALHFNSDIWSSAVVMLGLALVGFGIDGADAIAALFVAIFVLYAGFKLAKRTLDVLLDTAPEGVSEEIIKIATRAHGVLGVEKIRVRPGGLVVYIEIVLTVSRKLPPKEVAKIIDDLEISIKKRYPESDLSIAAKPVSLDDESIFERIHIISRNRGLSVHDISMYSNKGRINISFDLEVASNLSLEEGHEQASALEKELIKELGDHVSVITHLEPANEDFIGGEDVNAADMKTIIDIFEKVKLEIKEAELIHDIKAKKNHDRFFVTLHCYFEKTLSIEEAHSVATRIEYIAKGKSPLIQKVIVHMEPK